MQREVLRGFSQKQDLYRVSGTRIRHRKVLGDTGEQGAAFFATHQNPDSSTVFVIQTFHSLQESSPA